MAVEERQDHQRVAFAGVEQPVQRDERRCDVTLVDGIGEGPRRHRPRMAEVGPTSSDVNEAPSP